MVVTTHATPAPLLAIALDQPAGADLDARSRWCWWPTGTSTRRPSARWSDLAAADPRLVVLAPGRVGRGRALNLGIEAARAPLVAIQDADDASTPAGSRSRRPCWAACPSWRRWATDAMVVDGPEAVADWDLPGDALEVRILGRPIAAVLELGAALVADDPSGGGGRGGLRRTPDRPVRLRPAAAHSGRPVLVGHCNLPLVLQRRHAAQYFEGLQPLQRGPGARVGSNSTTSPRNAAASDCALRAWPWSGWRTRWPRGFAWHRVIRRVTPLTASAPCERSPRARRYDCARLAFRSLLSLN